MATLIDKNTVTLLRIPFSFLLMPLFLLALSLSGISIFDSKVIASFIIIHLLIYPSSNGYNSYIDKDEESIGGLEKPPMPTIKLFYVTLFLDTLALILAFVLIDWKFSACILLYILASRAYSSKTIRLKKYPYIGFLTVVFFQGAFTYYMCTVGITGQLLELNQHSIYLLIACSLQIAGAYPLTQIYQHRQDFNEGVITISYKLGYIGTFLFTGFMFLCTNVFYFIYFNATESLSSFFMLQLFFLPIVAYYMYWFSAVIKDKGAANFKHTMRMNLIAAVCMNSCFIVLNVINRIS